MFPFCTKYGDSVWIRIPTPVLMLSMQRNWIRVTRSVALCFFASQYRKPLAWLHSIIFDLLCKSWCFVKSWIIPWFSTFSTNAFSLSNKNQTHHQESQLKMYVFSQHIFFLIYFRSTPAYRLSCFLERLPSIAIYNQCNWQTRQTCLEKGASLEFPSTDCNSGRTWSVTNAFKF